MRRLLCWFGRHTWWARGPYRRVCQHCARVEFWRTWNGVDEWVEAI